MLGTVRRTCLACSCKVFVRFQRDPEPKQYGPALAVFDSMNPVADALRIEGRV